MNSAGAHRQLLQIYTIHAKVPATVPRISRQMEFNSRLLKLNDDADIMEELKGLTPEQLKALIAMVKKS